MTLLQSGLRLTADDEGNKVEERYPGLLRKELLGKRQTDWRGDPADPHDRPETGSDCSPHLVKRSGTGDYSHEHKVHAILDW